MSNLNEDEELARIRHQKMVKIMQGALKKVEIPDKPVYVSSKDHFKQLVNDYQEIPILVDFWASWCGPCRMLAPIFEQLAAEYKGKVIFLKVNTDELPELATYFGVTGIPDVTLIHRKAVKTKWIGVRPLGFYQESLNSFLKSIAP